MGLCLYNISKCLMKFYMFIQNDKLHRTISKGLILFRRVNPSHIQEQNIKKKQRYEIKFHSRKILLRIKHELNETACV